MAEMAAGHDWSVYKRQCRRCGVTEDALVAGGPQSCTLRMLNERPPARVNVDVSEQSWYVTPAPLASPAEVQAMAAAARPRIDWARGWRFETLEFAPWRGRRATAAFAFDDGEWSAYAVPAARPDQFREGRAATQDAARVAAVEALRDLGVDVDSGRCRRDGCWSPDREAVSSFCSEACYWAAADGSGVGAPAVVAPAPAVAPAFHVGDEVRAGSRVVVVVDTPEGWATQADRVWVEGLNDGGSRMLAYYPPTRLALVRCPHGDRSGVRNGAPALTREQFEDAIRIHREEWPADAPRTWTEPGTGEPAPERPATASEPDDEWEPRTWVEPGTGRVYPHKDAPRCWYPMDDGYDEDNPTEKALRRPKTRVVGEYGRTETIAPENAQAAWRVDIERLALARVPPFCVACGAPLSAVRTLPPRCGRCA